MFITTHYIVKYVTPCHQSDPNINECVKKAIVQIQPRLRDGLPELMIPPCEPFYVPQVTIRQNAGAISMESVYSSIHMYGVTNFTLQDVRYVTAKRVNKENTTDFIICIYRFNLEKLNFEINVLFPNLRMSANYNINGKILMLPLSGHGPCHGNYCKYTKRRKFRQFHFFLTIFPANIDATVTLKAEKNVIKNTEYLKVRTLTVAFKIGKGFVRLDDLFNGDKELGETMNTFLNENFQVVSDEMRPPLEDAVAKVLESMADKFFSAYPLVELMPL